MKLLTYRLKNKLTLSELAERLKISIGHLNMVESGKRLAGPKLAAKIEKATEGDVSFNDVYFTLSIKKRR